MIRTIKFNVSALPRSIAHAKSSRCGAFLDPSSNLREPQTNATARTFSTGTADRKKDRLLVVGSGVAGSAAALIAAETYKIPVTLLFAGSIPQDCNSHWAQGGIIYRNYDPNSGDSADSLARDIHRAGAGLCVDKAVRKVSEEGPSRVRELLLNGGRFAKVPFDKKPDGELALCLGTFSLVRIFSKEKRNDKLIHLFLLQRHPMQSQEFCTMRITLV
jgi:aspartate oxidase